MELEDFLKKYKRCPKCYSGIEAVIQTTETIYINQGAKIGVLNELTTKIISALCPNKDWTWKGD